MAILGFIFCLIFSVLVMLVPIPIVCLSALGGGMNKRECAVTISIFLFGCYLLYLTISNSPVTVVAN